MKRVVLFHRGKTPVVYDAATVKALGQAAYAILKERFEAGAYDKLTDDQRKRAADILEGAKEKKESSFAYAWLRSVGFDHPEEQVHLLLVLPPGETE